MNTFILGVETFPYYPLPSIPKVGLAYLRLKIFIGTSEILVLFCLSSNFYWELFASSLLWCSILKRNRCITKRCRVWGELALIPVASLVVCQTVKSVHLP